MKKFIFGMITVLLFSSCSMISNLLTPNDKGCVVVCFGNGGRAVYSVNKDNVVLYEVELKGPVKRSEVAKNDGTVTFGEIPAGTYTIYVTPYSEAIAGTTQSAKVTVVAGETTVADLSLKKSSVLSTKVMYDINGSIMIYDEPSEIPDDFKNDDMAFNAKDVEETGDGSVYYIDTGTYDLKKLGTTDKISTSVIVVGPSSHNLGNGGKLYYDSLNDVLYIFSYYDGYGILGKYNSSTRTVEKVFASEMEIFGDISNWKEFCVEGNNFFLLLNNSVNYGTFSDGNFTERKCRRFTDLSEKLDSVGVISLSVKDARIIDKGDLYILINQFETGNGFNWFNMSNDMNVCARGVLVKLKYNDSDIALEKETGWYGKKRELVSTGTREENGDEVSKINLYAPSKAEAGKYFYGPQKIVCIRPKELYIVDEGINVRLADWTKYHENCHCNEREDLSEEYSKYEKTDGSKGMSGNMFIHTRLVKVNLENFALNIEKEQVRPYYTVNVSGSAGNVSYGKNRNSLVFKNDEGSEFIISGGLGYPPSNAGTSGYLGVHPFQEEE